LSPHPNLSISLSLPAPASVPELAALHADPLVQNSPEPAFSIERASVPAAASAFSQALEKRARYLKITTSAFQKAQVQTRLVHRLLECRYHVHSLEKIWLKDDVADYGEFVQFPCQ